MQGRLCRAKQGPPSLLGIQRGSLTWDFPFEIDGPGVVVNSHSHDHRACPQATGRGRDDAVINTVSLEVDVQFSRSFLGPGQSS